MSETKSTNGANDPHARRVRVSHTLTTPSSSPVARMFASRATSLLIAALCAFSSRATAAPVATSDARMDRSEPPDRSSAPSFANAIERHASSWHFSVLRRVHA